ncbi:adipocyte plasma membrane-associated protein-like [Hyalella azteca]|uniref:Adipocyte plasma membrane-associated protein-like n=1 Tax=Hyalella azteca TaxID=294128 RepID=A0A8B7NPS9_HYAAZ|nr:adipocyte plasma membrane-associated protein-like [Hyalella azteca]
MMNCIKFLSWFLVHSVLFLTILTFIPGLPPHGDFLVEEIAPTTPREGPFALNNILDRAQRHYENVFVGPESVAYRNKPNEIFVSMHGGSIIKITGSSYSEVEEVVKIGPGCEGYWEEKVCGRPLGLRFGHDGKLLVADSYLGIFKVDVDAGTKEHLLDSKEPINGTRPMIVDDIDEDIEGNLYWSDASTIASLDAGALEILAGPTGRLIKTDVKTGKNIVLLDKLFFANGVQLSPKEDFVLVCETIRSRVIRYWLKGEKAGTHDVFIDGLPGHPDNIRAKPGGGYYLSLVAMKSSNSIDMIGTLLRLPWLRRLLARIGYGTTNILEMAAHYFQSQFLARVSYAVLDLATTAATFGKEGSMVVILDAEGYAKYSLQSPAGVVGSVSEATETNDMLVLGSPYNKFLAMIPLEKIKPSRSGAKPTRPIEMNLGGSLANAAGSDDKGGSPVAKDGGPAAKDGGPAAKDGGPAAKDGGPAAKVGGPAAKVGGPAAKDGGPAAKDGGPAAKDRGSAAKDGGPAAKDVGSAGKEEL